MVNRKHVAAVAGAIIVLLLLLFYPTRERQVKKRFKLLREWVHVAQPEDTATQVGKFRECMDLIDDPLEFESKGHQFSRKIPAQDAAQQATGWRSRFQSLEVEFADLSVTFPDDQQSLATATVRISGMTEGGEKIEETHELQSLLRKSDKGWRFSRFELVQVLEK